jgi:thiamine biosynthesis lipoprotein
VSASTAVTTTSPTYALRRAAPTRYVDHVMGMPVSLALRGVHRDSRLARRAWEAVTADLRRADEVFSTYRADSWVSRFNRGEAPAPTPLVEEVLAIGEAAERESEGAFSVHLVGSDGRAWLDPSGVVKGWAVERAARHLLSLPGTDFCLAVAGDMRCHVTSATSPAWRIGMTDPMATTRLLATVEVRDGGLATSGTSARGGHVLDGRTGRPVVGLAQVTVVADTLTAADVAATTALALGHDAVPWLEARPRTRAWVIPDDGSPMVRLGE